MKLLLLSKSKENKSTNRQLWFFTSKIRSSKNHLVSELHHECVRCIRYQHALSVCSSPWAGRDAGDDSLPGDLPDRPGDDGHGHEGPHGGPPPVTFRLKWTNQIASFSHSYVFVFFTSFSGRFDQLREEKKGELHFPFWLQRSVKRTQKNKCF